MTGTIRIIMNLYSYGQEVMWMYIGDSDIGEIIRIYEGRLKICRSKKMELYESFATGNLTKEEYLDQKGDISKKEAEYKAQSHELQEKIAEAEARKAKEENSGLKAFIKYKNLEALSYSIIQELIREIRFYDPEHIEVIWNYQDDYLETARNNAE